MEKANYFPSGFNLGNGQEVAQWFQQYQCPQELINVYGRLDNADRQSLATTLCEIFQQAQVAAQSGNDRSVVLTNDWCNRTSFGAIRLLLPIFTSLNWTVVVPRRGDGRPSHHFRSDDPNLMDGVRLIWLPNDPHLVSRPAMPVYTPILNPMGENFWAMNQAGQFADFTFIITGENGETTEIPVNKMVLVPRSKFFEKMFTGPMAPAGNKGESHFTTDPVLLKDFLYYIYTGELPKDSVSKLANPEYCLALYELANATETNELKTLCAIELAKALDSECLLQIAGAALTFDDQPLLEQCRWFVRTNPKLSDEFEAPEDLSMEGLLSFIDLTQAIGAISPPAVAARRHDVDSLQEMFCQQLEKVNNAEDFATLCKYTVRIGERLAERGPLYKRLKEVCKVGREQPLNDLIKQNPEALNAFSDVLLKPRALKV